MTTDFTSKPLVHTIAGAADVSVEQHAYATPQGSLDFDLYRPPHSTMPSPALVFVSGYPDPGMAAMFGKPIKDWASYIGWARMVAASGVAGMAYLNRTPQDIVALLQHLRQNTSVLRIDPARTRLRCGAAGEQLGLFAPPTPPLGDRIGETNACSSYAL